MTDRLPTAPAARPDEALDDGIDLRELFGILLSGWPYILAATVLGLAASFWYLFVTPPTYSTDALVQVEENSNSARIAFAQTADSIGSDIPVAAEIEILRSRMVLGRVVERLGLDIQAHPLRMPWLGDAFARRHGGDRFGRAPAWLQPLNRSEYSWGGEKITVTSLEVPPNMVGVPLYVLKQEGDAFALVDANYQPLVSGLVGERLVTQVSSERLSIFVQELVGEPGRVFQVRKLRRESAIGAVQRGLAATASRNAEGIVTLRYEGGDPEQIARILTEVLNVYQRQNIDRRSAEAEQTLDFLSQQLPELRKEVETAEARLNQFKVQQGTADLTQETAAVLTRSVELEQAKSVLVQERTEALQRYTVNHPVVESLDSQIAQVNSQLARVSERVRKLPDIEQKALQLSRDLEVSTALYISLLNRTQELEVVKSGTIGSIRIVDLPVKPVHPTAPSKPKSLIIGLLAGLILGTGFAFLMHLLRNGVEDPSEVEKKLGLPTYGTIPYSQEQGKLAKLLDKNKIAPLMLAIAEPKGPAMEAIRSVRTALHFAAMDAPNNIIMLTGPEPDLGKSFVSINLGAALADAGRRVVVIDADMRRGHLHKMVNKTREPGLSDMISGAAKPEACVKSTPFPNLWVIPTGTLPPNPSEMLVNERFVELINGLSRSFDHVIIDTPPVLAVTDAAIIGRHAGISLIVLKAGQHPMRMIEETATRLHRAGVQVRGTLFNQVGRGRHGRYGYKYGYYYGGYKYNYGTAKK